MQTFKMRNVVDVISEAVSDPAHSGCDVFVGLEHYDIGEPIITRYSSTKMLSTAAKRFRNGDVLLARRNVYLRRAGVVRFDGLTSGDSIVLRPVDNTDVCEALIPFVLNTDAFWRYAEMYSDGTMSKRLSPKTLLDYEFDLPPLARQKELAELLWAANDLKESYKKMIAATDEMLKAKFREIFGECGVRNAEGGVSVGEIAELVTKGTTPTSVGFQFEDQGVNFLKAENITDDGRFLRDAMMHISDVCNEKLRRSQLKAGDYLFSIAGVIGRTAIVDGAILPCNTNQAISIIRLKDFAELDRAFFGVLLRSEFVLKQCELQQKQTAQANISLEDVKNIKIPLPPLALQQQFVEIARKADETKAALKKSIADIDQVIRGLING